MSWFESSINFRNVQTKTNALPRYLGILILFVTCFLPLGREGYWNRNVCPSVCLSVVQFSRIPYIRSSPNLVGWLIYKSSWTLFKDVMMTSSPAQRFTDYRRKWYILHNNSAISHPIFTKLSINDGIGSVSKHLQWRYDDVITGFTVHWLQTKMVHFAH